MKPVVSGPIRHGGEPALRWAERKDMIDILYLAKGRTEFTLGSLRSLIENTDWARARLAIYTDGDDSSELKWRRELTDAMVSRKLAVTIRSQVCGGPAAVMNAYFHSEDALDLVIKLDNDAVVPPGWLDRCVSVMDANPELDLLGIEPPSSTIKVSLAGAKNGYAPCDSIGGIGLMRRRAFEGRTPLKAHSIYGGFTDWQLAHPEVKKGWLAPSIPLVLLDRLPMEPWLSLSKRYIAEGNQRPWKNYGPEDAHLWEWWLPSTYACGGVIEAGQPYLVGER